MITLVRMRLINWYAFSEITLPIGRFTLIAGKNGNGKSVLLDAIKYGLFGDTVFNKSTDNKGKRSIPTYTRGLLDATVNSYIRSPENYPNVYSHIALECYDDADERYFVLGTVIETNSANSIMSFRYVCDKTKLADLEHIYEEEGIRKVYDHAGFQKEYGVQMIPAKEQGIKQFTQMLGLKFLPEQTNIYLRKLRSMMSYDPTARLDRFIKDSVLEDRPVDFTKLIEAKDNIERLNVTMEGIKEEINELESILKEFDLLEAEEKRLLIDDIKQVYKRLVEDQEHTLEYERQLKSLAETKDHLVNVISILDAKKNEQTGQLYETEEALKRIDGTDIIVKSEERLEKLKESKQKLETECRELNDFHETVRSISAVLRERGEDIKDSEDVLSGLTGTRFTFTQKKQAVGDLYARMEKVHDACIKETVEYEKSLSNLSADLEKYQRIVDNAGKSRNDHSEIPDYTGLRDEINRELERRGISKRAGLACEYVLSLRDEKWRDAIECFLGKRRYVVLVPAEYYDIADDIFNKTKYRKAHLFNTALLMKKDIKTVENSVYEKLEIKNEEAGQYFKYILGRIHAVKTEDVKKYENAMSSRGRVCVSMDSYFLEFGRLTTYYLGRDAMELNRIRAEKEIEKIKLLKDGLREKKDAADTAKSRLEGFRPAFKEYNYDAHKNRTEVNEAIKEVEATINDLKAAMEHNSEFMELSLRREHLQEEIDATNRAFDEARKKQTETEVEFMSVSSNLQDLEKELPEIQEKLEEYEEREHTAFTKAVNDYDRFLQNGKTGSGGTVMDDTRRKIQGEIKNHKEELINMQGEYNGKRPGSKLTPGTDSRGIYEQRKNTIWIDDMQDIQNRLSEQTKKYEDIFKNEFVLTVLRSCNKALDDIKLINDELGRLKFNSVYEFDVRTLKDGSDYEKILDYARYLDEKEQLGGENGQMVFDPSGKFEYSVSDEEELEENIRRIINDIIDKNNTDVIADFADYRNYMSYEVLVTNDVLDHAKLSKQTGYNSGAEVQIPYILILSSALLMIYNERVDSGRFVFIDEPFAKMDPGNVKAMLEFMRSQNLQVILCSPDKTEVIGNECDVVLPILRTAPETMISGVIQFHEK